MIQVWLWVDGWLVTFALSFVRWDLQAWELLLADSAFNWMVTVILVPINIPGKILNVAEVARHWLWTLIYMGIKVVTPWEFILASTALCWLITLALMSINLLDGEVQLAESASAGPWTSPQTTKIMCHRSISKGMRRVRLK